MPNRKKGNLYDALSYYTKAIELGLESPVVYNDMGVLYEQVNLRTKAEQFYLKAMALDDKYLPTYSNLAYYYQADGDQERAFI